MNNNETISLFAYKKLIILTAIHIVSTILFLYIFAAMEYKIPGAAFIDKYDEPVFYFWVIMGLVRDITFVIILIGTLIERWVSKNNKCLLFNIVIIVTFIVSLVVERETFIYGLSWFLHPFE